ncbi:MAG: hypothetical protein QF419_06795 [Acidimicrobiales bacterium]|nr:hypothetical protein [Acidimicrobiales bacterium]
MALGNLLLLRLVIGRRGVISGNGEALDITFGWVAVGVVDVGVFGGRRDG